MYSKCCKMQNFPFDIYQSKLGQSFRTLLNCLLEKTEQSSIILGNKYFQLVFVFHRCHFKIICNITAYFRNKINKLIKFHQIIINSKTKQFLFRLCQRNNYRNYQIYRIYRWVEIVSCPYHRWLYWICSTYVNYTWINWIGCWKLIRGKWSS